ncbi:MAG: LamG domain-containing protein, partial [Planctomycetota bacterium]
YPNVDYNHTDACNYAPGFLDLDQIFYWRVDEVSDTCDASPWKGRIWKFTVAGYIAIDDMEDYTGSWAGEGDHPLDEGWADYYGNGTNATITLQTNSPVRDKQSMEYAYDNQWLHSLGYCSEIQNLELDPTDWTDQDVMVLSLWFYGWPDNDAAGDANQMYVSVLDDDGLYAELRYGDNEGEDMNDIKIEAWQRWDMPLTYFSDGNFAAVANDVNLADVNVFSIGFGERNGSQPGGSGYVYFDDIRLYPSSCRPDKIQPEGDLNNDCTVDFEDVEIMASEWLETDVNLGEVKEPCDANLVGWWKLDDGDGNKATDDSGKDHHGTLQILDVNVSWVSGRNDVNSALEFDGGRVRVPDHQDLRPLDEVSACAWIYYSEQQNAARVVVKGADNKETYEIEVSEDDSLVFHVRDGNDYDAGDDDYARYAAESNDNTLDRDEWIHAAGTYDGNVIKVYINGEVADVCDTHGAILYLCQDTNDFAIGNRSDEDNRGFEGTIDDVRVYNYGLSCLQLWSVRRGGRLHCQRRRRHCYGVVDC